jgi:hypothetical protein
MINKKMEKMNNKLNHSEDPEKHSQDLESYRKHLLQVYFNRRGDKQEEEE